MRLAHQGSGRMQEQEIRLTTVLAATLWTLGVGLVVAGLITERYGIPSLGTTLVMAGSVTQIRGFFAEHRHCIQQAFDLGCDYERGKKADVRQLR